MGDPFGRWKVGAGETAAAPCLLSGPPHTESPLEIPGFRLETSPTPVVEENAFGLPVTDFVAPKEHPSQAGVRGDRAGKLAARRRLTILKATLQLSH